MISATASPSVVDRFALIIDGLCRAVPTLIARDRSAGPLIMLIYSRLRALAARFAVLAAGVRPAPRRCRGTRTARLRSPRLLPGGFGWLVRLVPEAAAFGAQLQHLLLNDPEMVALIAAVPGVGRVLRPVLWMTAVRPVPEVVRTQAGLPPPSRKAGGGVRPAGGLTGQNLLVDGPLPRPLPLGEGGRARPRLLISRYPYMTRPIIQERDAPCPIPTCNTTTR